MTWIRENKFLAAFFGFMIVGIGGLTFLLLQAKGHFEEVDTEYNSKKQTLSGLEASVPYPYEENLKKYKEQQSELSEAITALEKGESAIQYPLDAVTPEQFQDNLRSAVNAINEKVKDKKSDKTKGVVPDKFGLGFERYLTETPSKDAAPALARELKAIDLVVNELIDSHVDSINSISRKELPEEGAKQAKPAKPSLVVKNVVDINFSCEQGRLRKILNDLMDTKKQFYIVRLIAIKNQKDRAPSKAAPGGPNPQTGQSDKLAYIVGTEKLDVTLRLEILNFNLPQK